MPGRAKWVELRLSDAQHSPPNRDELGKTLVLDGSHESLGVGVHIRRPRRQSNDPNALSLERDPESRGVLGITIDDQVLLVA